jgi:hypothetical protein
MPYKSIDNCASVKEAVPSFACGQMKRPRSNRFAYRHRPSSLAQRILIVSPPAPPKNKEVSGKWLLLEYQLHLRTHPRKASPHIGHARGDPDACACAQFDHLRKLFTAGFPCKRRSLARVMRIVCSTARSAPCSTVIATRPGNSM